MKFFACLLGVGLLINSVDAANAGCGSGKVPAMGNGVCIEPNYIEGCKLYKDANSCGGCESSYSNKNGRCDYVGGASSSNSSHGCLEFNLGSGKCDNCANGYRLSNGKCVNGVKNCVKYGNKGECLDCENDFSLVLDSCKHNLLLGCRNESADHACKECFPPFKMNGNHCDIAHCKSYNDFGCVGCECGYYLTAEMTCKEITEGCIKYERGVCSNCLPHYKIVGGVCKIDGCETYKTNKCEKCADKYVLAKDGGCEFKNCDDWFDGVCTVCKQGFRRQNGECIKVNEAELKCN